MSGLLHELLADAAAHDPDAVAVVDGDRGISYGELDAGANRVARSLAREGIGPGQRVGLYLEKSIEALTGLYGILKAGAAYVPVDPDAPLARVGAILADCGVRTLVTSGRLRDRWSGLPAVGVSPALVLVLDEERPHSPPGVRAVGAEAIRELPARAPETPVTESDLAYVLYTSGSTGTPKGVMLSHGNGRAFVDWAARTFRLDMTDRLSSLAPLHFDLSVLDVFAAARAGAAVVLVPRRLAAFPPLLTRLVAEQGITVWYSVPSLLVMLAARGGLSPGDLPQLRTVLFAGEVFPARHLRRLMGLLPHARFANLYGPTETNVCTWQEVTDPPLDDEDIPIGRPVDGTEVLVLGDDGRPAGPGEVGELLVLGPTVMQGYWGDPERTAHALVTPPPGTRHPGPAYRTGDLVVRGADGVLAFLGRRDSQVKSRGYRIELREVERHLEEHPGVDECAVVAVPDEVAGCLLVAFVVSRTAATRQQLGSFCASRLPAYMLPAHIELVPALPRTSTDKVDRQALTERWTRRDQRPSRQEVSHETAGR
ncbi:amino acid adenylation domain-containing protein [Streptomyces flaveolus]|uniref:amino acid adenylation domain-containing protein n=1 Tax=Streptomyces flaveolus TaxID=67297 RepID=UPI0033B51FDC